MNPRNMFLLFIAMVVLTTQSTARIFPKTSLVDTNDNVAMRDEYLQTSYDNLMNYLNMEPHIRGEDVHVFESSISPANAPAPTPVPKLSHKHKHKHNEDHHHKHDHEEHHHKHEHEHDHHHNHHKHNPHHEPQALPPTGPTSAPTQSPESFLTWV
ncbi:hypothetical protein R6Q59_007999 [Mikania micrantha]